jgi:hypothetical protein
MEAHIFELGLCYLKIGLVCSTSFWVTNTYTLIFNTPLYNRIFVTNVASIQDIRANIIDTSLISMIMLFMWPYIYPMFVIGYFVLYI